MSIEIFIDIYESLCDNADYIDLNFKEIMGIKKEALKYFALNNVIELKLYNKKIHVNTRPMRIIHERNNIFL